MGVGTGATSVAALVFGTDGAAFPGGGGVGGSAVPPSFFTCTVGEEAMELFQPISQPSSHAALKAGGREPRGAPSAGTAASVRVSRLPSHSITVSVELERPAVAYRVLGFAA